MLVQICGMVLLDLKWNEWGKKEWKLLFHSQSDFLIFFFFAFICSQFVEQFAQLQFQIHLDFSLNVFLIPFYLSSRTFCSSLFFFLFTFSSSYSYILFFYSILHLSAIHSHFSWEGYSSLSVCVCARGTLSTQPHQVRKAALFIINQRSLTPPSCFLPVHYFSFHRYSTITSFPLTLSIYYYYYY